MKIKYEAFDGVSFDTEKECMEHEAEITLQNFIEKYIQTTHLADLGEWGTNVILPEDVAKFVKEHLEEITRLVLAFPWDK